MVSKKIANYKGPLDLAILFVDLFPLYFDNSKKWWLWDKISFRWRTIDEVDLLNLISDASDFDTVKGKYEILESLRQIARKKKPKDPEKGLIQFKDRIVNIKTGKKFKASPEYFFTNPIPWKLGRSKSTPHFDKLFKEWVVKEGIQDESWVKTLYEVLAYSLLNAMPLHQIICLIGGGSNGKGTFLKILENFVGGYNVTSTNFDSLINVRFETHKLHKKLVCSISELDNSIFRRTALLKQITGDDKVRLEEKGKNGFEDYLYAKPLINCNLLPETTDKTDGFFRRWLIINFPNQFAKNKDILSKIPNKEYENLALKSIDILRDLLKRGEFTNLGTIEERKKRYEERSNPINDFIKEFFIEGENLSILFEEFYSLFEDYLKGRNFRILSKKEVGMLLKNKGYFSKREGYKTDEEKNSTRLVYYGFGLK